MGPLMALMIIIGAITFFIIGIGGGISLMEFLDDKSRLDSRIIWKKFDKKLCDKIIKDGYLENDSSYKYKIITPSNQYIIGTIGFPIYKVFYHPTFSVKECRYMIKQLEKKKYRQEMQKRHEIRQSIKESK